jgi:hypothetical protein
MNNQIIEWLLGGPSWIKYAVEMHLLGSQPSSQNVLNDAVINEIVDRLKDKRRGIPAIRNGSMNSDENENPYWDLFFLADLGLKSRDLKLNQEIVDFLTLQHQDGTYVTESGMQSNYLCKSAILISSIASLGYQDDTHVAKYLQMFLSRQRLDGGWYCNPNHDIGSFFECEPSCPQENLNLLMLLGQYEKYRHDSRFNGAIDLLLKHWEMRHTGAQIVYFGVGRRYQSLQYPATRYGILRVLDAISLFPYALKQASFHNMLDFVHHKAREGKYFVETASSYTDLEPGGEPNRLITFIINRIDKRVEVGR